MTSLLDELQNEQHIVIAAAKKDFSAITIGQIHQIALVACDKLCEQYKFFKNLLNKKSNFKKACQQTHLQIKRKDKSCHCGPLTTLRHQRRKHHNQTQLFPWKTQFFGRKSRRGKAKSLKCFNGEKEGHYGR